MTGARSPLLRLLQQAATRRESATSLALFRMGLGVAALYSLWLLHAGGAVDAIWLEARHGGIFELQAQHWLFRLFGHRPAVVHSLVYLSTLGASCVLLGVGGRVSILVCQQCYAALRELNGNTTGGYDSLISIGLLLLLFTRPTATLSLDARLRSGSWTTSEQVAAWPRAIAVFQVLLMYTASGLQKVGYTWTPLGGYTALYYVLNDPTWLRFDLGAIPAALDLPLRAATFVTWHWEQLSLLLLLHWYFRADATKQWGWFGRCFVRWDLRRPWAAVGICMHLGIWCLFDVGPFSLTSMAYYICLWGPGTWERRLRPPQHAGAAAATVPGAPTDAV